MQSDVNQSQWKTAFETALSKAPGFSICEISCIYNNGIDPRIPTIISGRSINFEMSDLFEHSALTTKDVRRPLREQVKTFLQQKARHLKSNFEAYYAAPNGLHQLIFNSLRPTLPGNSLLARHQVTVKKHEGSVTQSVMAPKVPSVAVEAGKLWELLDNHYDSRTDVDYSGALLLHHFDEHMVTELRKARRPREAKNPLLYSLPPANKRPYQAVSYKHRRAHET
jgi:hypothetical protein